MTTADRVRSSAAHEHEGEKGDHMSRGLGRVERTILDALHATTRPYVALWELALLVDGQVTTLQERAPHWNDLICTPHPPRVLFGFVRKHDFSCYPVQRPETSVEESTSRAVRSLARKGLVRREYSVYAPKRLVVGLASTDPDLFPRGEMRLTALKAHLVLGLPLPRGRYGYALGFGNPTLINRGDGHESS
jgi:hypothetical protein